MENLISFVTNNATAVFEGVSALVVAIVAFRLVKRIIRSITSGMASSGEERVWSDTTQSWNKKSEGWKN